MNERLMRLTDADVSTRLTRLDVNPENSYVNLVADSLGQFVYGQEQPVHAVAKRIAMFEAGLNNPHRPLGSIYELGPTGTGKTELAKASARYLFGEKDWRERMKVINCSELSESHTTQRLTGSPPGYVGYREQALIPHDWLHAGRSVIVFDEVEKAHPAVHKLLLGVLEEATLDARHGEKGSEPLHFNNALLFFTSNVGADEMQKIREGKGQLGFRQKEQTLTEQLQAIESVAKTALRKSFAPEFLGRIDDFVTFQPLEKEHYDKIFYKFLEEINADFQQTQPNPTTLLATLDLKEHILEILGKEYGARDMRHLLDTEVLDRFTDVVMEHDVAGAYVIGSYTPDKGVQFYTDRKDTRRLPIEDTVFEPEPKKKRTDVPQQYSHRRRKRRRY